MNHNTGQTAHLAWWLCSRKILAIHPLGKMYIHGLAMNKFDNLTIAHIFGPERFWLGIHDLRLDVDLRQIRQSMYVCIFCRLSFVFLNPSEWFSAKRAIQQSQPQEADIMEEACPKVIQFGFKDYAVDGGSKKRTAVYARSVAQKSVTPSAKHPTLTHR